MDPHEHPQSALPSRPGTLFAENWQPALGVEAEQPRLRIIHLLVWTACVAAYFGLTRSLWVEGAAPPADPQTALRGLYGLGAGTAVAGLLLWFARRWRGARFPTFPGEYLWVALGLYCVVSTVNMAFFRLLFSLGESGSSAPLLIDAVVFVSGAFRWIVLLVAALHFRTCRWRWFFLSFLTVDVLSTILQCGGLALWWPYIHFTYLLPAVVLGVVVLMCFLQREAFPWPHWVGIGIQVWFSLVGIGWSVWQIILQRAGGP